MLARAQLSGSIDLSAHSDAFARHGWVQIPGVFDDDSAQAISRYLAADIPWRYMLNVGKKKIDCVKESLDSLSPADRHDFLSVLHESAATKFQYLMASYPLLSPTQVSQKEHPSAEVLSEFFRSQCFLTFMKELIRWDDPLIADSSAAMYGPGHFLGMHNDRKLPERRIAAYVFNFSKDWRADWGGVLNLMTGPAQSVGLVPTFNTLNVFRVPFPHYVSYIAPYAKAARYTIHGWLHAT